MLEEILRSSRFASRDELHFLLFKALPLSNGQKVSELKTYCTSNHFSIGRSFDETIKLLELMMFISISGGIIKINNDLFNPLEIEQPEEYFEQDAFVRNLILSLKRENAIRFFLKPDALRRDATRGLFYVRNSLIPVHYWGIRNLLISLGFFEQDSTLGSSNLLVRASNTELFETLVVGSLREEKRNHKRRITLAGLKNRHEVQEELGEQAESFVLEFEQHRLQGHPSIQNIQRISSEYANAGFDIESFDDLESVFANRFIEVKSY